jgi:hypothetical protein
MSDLQKRTGGSHSTSDHEQPERETKELSPLITGCANRFRPARAPRGDLCRDEACAALPQTIQTKSLTLVGQTPCRKIGRNQRR